MRAIQIAIKGFIARGYAIGPISRKQEAELRAFLDDDRAVWLHRNRATDR